MVTLVSRKTVVGSFIGKLRFYRKHARREFYQFPRLAELKLTDDDLLPYCEHLEVLKDDMIKRFTDLLKLEPTDRIIDPYRQILVVL